MKRNFAIYEELITKGNFQLDTGQSITSENLWDLIIITAINEQQKKCYEKQIETKLLKKQIPEIFTYLVINDPENCKIGSGGSTFHVIKRLFDLYNQSLYEKKILLIHAGGYSQRMPSCTVLGKIFSPVASECPSINDILDIKLSTYTPFSINMKPGIFLVSSDDIITCDFEEQVESGKLFGYDKNEFIFLAHRSSLEIGKDHGVYCPGNELKSDDFKFKAYDAKFVLQKPTVQKMKDLKVVLIEDNNNQQIQEYVLSDSSFYFTHEVTKLLLEFNNLYFDKICEHKIEIDAYRDFLQPLGTTPMSLDDYLINLKIYSDYQIKTEIFTDIYKKFKGRKSIILSLSKSNFYHLGTLNELFYYYFDNNLDALDFRKSVCYTDQKSKIQFDKLNEGCILFSNINQNLVLKSSSIIEYLQIDPEFTLILNGNNLISNCRLIKSEFDSLSDVRFEIPQNVCMHTISIKIENRLKFVTIFYGKNDDLKKMYKSLSELILLGTELNKGLTHLVKLDVPTSITFWNLRIFKAFHSMTESFVYSSKFVQKYFEINSKFEEFKSEEFYSLFDLLRLQNYDEMISHRYNLI